MNLATFDLNLLVTFDALMSERNVTKAGQKVGLSQPAMSAALGRLRYMLKDELFVRCTNGMRPTPRALEIAGPIEDILAKIRSTIEPSGFDPMQSDRRFRIAMNDLGAALFLPPIIRRLEARAPKIGFEVIHADEDRAIELLEDDRVDVAATLDSRESKSLNSVLLYEATFVCVLRKDHPSAGLKLTPKALADIDRVAIAQRGDPSELVDAQLAQHGLKQRVRTVVPHYLAVPFIVMQTDLLGVIPLKMARRSEFAAKMCVVQVPFEPITVPIRLVWSRAAHDDPANAWLRSVIIEVTRDYHLDRWIALPQRSPEPEPV